MKKYLTVTIIALMALGLLIFGGCQKSLDTKSSAGVFKDSKSASGSIFGDKSGESGKIFGGKESETGKIFGDKQSSGLTGEAIAELG